MSGQTAEEITRRFRTEQSHIRQYTEYLLDGSKIEDGQLFEIQDTLRNHRLPKLYTRPDSRLEEAFSPEELDSLIASLDTLTPVISSTQTRYRNEKAGWLPLLTSNGTSVSHPEELQEWVNYLFTQISMMPTGEGIKEVRRHSLQEAKLQTDSDLSEKDLVAIIDDAIETVVEIAQESRIAAMQNILDQFESLRFRARVSTPGAEINVLRQGFILLMTAFDAAIFDLMRFKFRSDFFSLIRVFADKDKADLKELGEDGSFEKFRDRIIGEQMKRRYLKDILLVLNQLDVQCVNAEAGYTFGHLIEMVLRRNLHVHNRGIVDERYVEPDKSGKSNYNLYDLKVGDAAPIDEDYWRMANRLCHYCVSGVASWATS